MRRKAWLVALALALSGLVSGSLPAQSLLGVDSAPQPALQPPAPGPAAAAPAAPAPDTGYNARLRAIREIAAKFPGRIGQAGHQYKELGLLAGIYMQTLWQYDSGRDRLPIWDQVNYNLTLAPRAYLDEYLADRNMPPERSPFVLANPTRDGARAPIQRAEACRAWKDYFRACEEARADRDSKNPFRWVRGWWNEHTTVNRKLWRAHTTAIRFALWQYQPEFAAVKVPEDELAFWRGWIKVVFLAEKIAPPTTDLLLKPFLALAMPPCSPLGTASCDADNQPAVRTAFLDWLMRGKIDQQEFLLAFGGRPTSGSGETMLAMRTAKVATAAAGARPAKGAASPALDPLREPGLTGPSTPATVDADVLALLDQASAAAR